MIVVYCPGRQALLIQDAGVVPLNARGLVWNGGMRGEPRSQTVQEPIAAAIPSRQLLQSKGQVGNPSALSTEVRQHRGKVVLRLSRLLQVLGMLSEPGLPPAADSSYVSFFCFLCVLTARALACPPRGAPFISTSRH